MLFCSADYFVFLNTNNGSLSSFIGPSIIFLVVVAIHEACEFFINITIFPKSAPLTCQSSQHNSVLVVLVDSLLKLTVLGMGRVGWVPLTPTCTPVPGVSTVMSSAYPAVASSPMDLTTPGIISVSFTIYQLAALSLTYVSTPLIRPPSMS